jgi:hypothetical protein
MTQTVWDVETTVSAGLDGVVAWGSNDCGECDVPPKLSGATSVAAGYGHSLAVTG